MKVGGTHYRSLWWDTAKNALQIIDQRWLPHDFRIQQLETVDDYAVAIRDMHVRGAPLIGATAAYGVAVQMALDCSEAGLTRATETLLATRPTAVNLRWALERCRDLLAPLSSAARADAALKLAHAIADEDVEINRRIGENGLQLISEIAAARNGEPVRILTHCNAGWLATVD